MKPHVIKRLEKLKNDLIDAKSSLEIRDNHLVENFDVVISDINTCIVEHNKNNNYKRVCYVCNAVFTTNRKNTVACSKSCVRQGANERYRLRRRAQRSAEKQQKLLQKQA
jgi:23S rRNA U2552 (ribose-2'-O)-methylase RlmE/FtsJ